MAALVFVNSLRPYKTFFDPSTGAPRPFETQSQGPWQSRRQTPRLAPVSVAGDRGDR